MTINQFPFKLIKIFKKFIFFKLKKKHFNNEVHIKKRKFKIFNFCLLVKLSIKKFFVPKLNFISSQIKSYIKCTEATAGVKITYLLLQEI